MALRELMFYQHNCEAAPEEGAVYLQGAEAGHAAPDVLRKQKQKKYVGWLVLGSLVSKDGQSNIS